MNIESDGTLSGHRIGLRYFIERLVHLIRPLVRNRLLRAQLDDYPRRGFRIVPLFCKMYVIFSEAGASLAPSPGEGDADGIKDRRFPGIVRTDEYGGWPQLNVQF